MTGGVVLVVDDDGDFCDTLRVVLEDEGFDVRTATHGLAALEYLKSNAAPRIVLLDLMMPSMDGWQFLDSVHSVPGLDTLPVVILSAVDDPEILQRPGVLGCLPKPVDLQRLLRALRTGETAL